MFIKYYAVLILLFYNVFYVDSLNILGIFPYTGKSHHYVNDPILTELARRGHEVTVISRFPPLTKVKNRKDIVFGHDNNLTGDVIDLGVIDSVPEYLEYIKIIHGMIYLTQNAKESCTYLFEDSRVMEIVNSKAKFDVILVEQFNSDCSLALVHLLGAPSIGLTSDLPLVWHWNRFGAPTNPSFVPCPDLGFGIKPNLIQTIVSWCVCTFVNLWYDLAITPPTERITREYLGNDIPSFEKLTRNISILMTNSYFSLHGAMPIAPNMVEIGGVHITKSKALPEDLQKILDESKNGVIYFSFGSMAKMSTLPTKKLTELQKAFSELPLTILWKWENDSMPNKPDNVIIKKWMPQFEILSHKNVKAFITHTGMLSTTEAIHCGVPIVSIPLFADQHLNGKSAEEIGLGVVLNFHDITKRDILNAINTVLDPKFRTNVKRVSGIWRDRPLSPMDTAIYWIEYVAKHGGVHLRPVSADIPLFRYLLLDVFLLLLLIFFATYKCCGFLCRICRKPGKHKTE